MLATYDVPSGSEMGNTSVAGHTFGKTHALTKVHEAEVYGAKVDTVTWVPGNLGYMPPRFEMTGQMGIDSRASFVTIPEKLFKSAAFETIDYDQVDFRWVESVEDKVTDGLYNALQLASDSVDAADFPIIAESISTALAVRLMQQLGGQRVRADVPHAAGLPPERIARVYDYVEANIAIQIRLDDLAGVALLSPYHFARAFKASTGFAPIRYVWQRRIERAKEALRSTQESLASVAYASGFSSQSHFATAFKQATGKTPAAWRAALASLVPGWLGLDLVADLVLAAA